MEEAELVKQWSIVNVEQNRLFLLGFKMVTCKKKIRLYVRRLTDFSEEELEFSSGMLEMKKLTKTLLIFVQD